MNAKNKYKFPLAFVLMVYTSVHILANKIDVDDIYNNCTKEAGIMNNAIVAECSTIASEVAKK